MNSVYEYNTLLNLWDEKTPLPTARGFLGAAAAGNKIHVVGGTNGEIDLDVHEVYSPDLDIQDSNPWSTLTPLPESRSHFGMVSIAVILHVVGGSKETDDHTALKYFPAKDKWETFDLPFEEVWTGLGVVQLGSSLQVMGGKLGDGIIRDNFSYQAIYTVSIPILP